MTDSIRKTETIRRIENLKLAAHFIAALDDHLQAEAIVEAVTCLETLNEQWN